ncbi:MAG: pyrimidine dimer DNA glycosylase/endonuclease V [Candidatus Odinarchaeota archaeon]
MRLWSIHPKYLDVKGLLALWREALLAKKVLEGRTKGYRHHPQLIRFKSAEDPLKAINTYLHFIFEESVERGYRFDRSKIDNSLVTTITIPVTSGQISYEFNHLLQKLEKRDPQKNKQLKRTKEVDLHPIFKKIGGNVEEWERKQ